MKAISAFLLIAVPSFFAFSPLFFFWCVCPFSFFFLGCLLFTWNHNFIFFSFSFLVNCTVALYEDEFYRVQIRNKRGGGSAILFSFVIISRQKGWGREEAGKKETKRERKKKRKEKIFVPYSVLIYINM